MLARFLLAVGVVVVAVVAAPTEEKGLPAEHRQSSTQAQTPHPIEDIMDAVLNSETVSAVDEAAAQVTSVFGEIIDDLGDFVVQRVKDLPDTIKQVSDTVSKAVSDGREQVVIVVKGVRNRVHNHTTAAVPTVVKTVDRVANATTSSKTAASFQDLHQRMAVSLSRIFGSLFYNMDEIDSAMADGIRRITVGDRNSNKADKASSQPPSQQQNEVEVLS
ncbi:uncharacterized protein LOC127000798 [Eriocheir sinensis]|uniref:uncharacterized protein LOC127000798 n=1 Tax=Eriocheir sinensis TaxID=95602 RepID=UPI0021C6A7A6|nr:uncharacterized protein LOC127000798 [Eriocheir sinensis]